jgi:hypothetical protein
MSSNTDKMFWHFITCRWVTNQSMVTPWPTEFQGFLAWNSGLNYTVIWPLRGKYWIFMLFLRYCISLYQNKSGKLNSWSHLSKIYYIILYYITLYYIILYYIILYYIIWSCLSCHIILYPTLPHHTIILYFQILIPPCWNYLYSNSNVLNRKAVLIVMN